MKSDARGALTRNQIARGDVVVDGDQLDVV